MGRTTLALCLCLAAALAAPLEDAVDAVPAATAAVKPDEISLLRSRFKEDVGLDVPDDDLLHLLEGAARFAMSAATLEDAPFAPPYPADAIKAEADVDDEPGNGDRAD